MNKIVHVVSRYKSEDKYTNRRISFAEQTWFTALYNHNVVPVHIWDKDYKRSSKDIGDERGTAYLKDILMAGLDSTTEDDDIIILTNDDTILHPDILKVILARMAYMSYCCSFRYDVCGEVCHMDDCLVDGIYRLIQSPGRDLFVFNRGWLCENLHRIPDYVLGATDWDYFLGILMRTRYSHAIDMMNIVVVDTLSELPMGYVYHEVHEAWWRKPENIDNSPAQKHNKRLTYKHLCKMGYQGKLYGARSCDVAHLQ